MKCRDHNGNSRGPKDRSLGKWGRNGNSTQQEDGISADLQFALCRYPFQHDSWGYWRLLATITRLGIVSMAKGEAHASVCLMRIAGGQRRSTHWNTVSKTHRNTHSVCVQTKSETYLWWKAKHIWCLCLSLISKGPATFRISAQRDT